ncbi:GTPase domain-containing protein [Caldiplasma sukawensis]
MSNMKYTWKVSFIGDPGNGKTSLISRVVYDSDHSTFSGKGLLRKKISITLKKKEYNIEFIIQEIDDKDENEKLLTGSGAIVVVIDVTKPLNEKDIKKKLSYLSSLERKPLVFIAATKSDRRYEAEFWKDDLNKIVGKEGTEVFFVSAKDGEEVKNMMETIGMKLLEKKLENGNSQD